MEQIRIAHKRIMDAVRLLAAANEHALADEAQHSLRNSTRSTSNIRKRGCRLWLVPFLSGECCLWRLGTP
jgi:hypothetical protein